MKKTRGLLRPGKENADHEADYNISSSGSDHDTTGEIPLSLSDSLSKKFEMAKMKEVP